MQTMLVALLLAQIPNPLLEPKFEEVKKDEPVKESTKNYVKPDKKALPEGDAEVLSGGIAMIHFDGMVTPAMGDFTMEALERAQDERKQALLIELDTPGGVVSTTQDIVKAIMKAKIPVIVFVTPSGAHAASAGTYIALAGHVAAMSPATRIGAAHPVLATGQDPEEAGKHMARKIENDLVAMVEGIAKERNRNAEWARDAVVDSVSATADKALEIGVIEFIARDADELMKKLDGYQLMVGGTKVELRTKDVPVTKYDQTARNWLMNFLASPLVLLMLLAFGVIGLIIEVKAPGGYIFGTVGVLCLLLAIMSVGELPIDVGAVILLVAGIAMVVAEIWTPTHGALAILGGIALAIGMVFIVDLSDPDFKIDPTFRLSFIDVVPVVIAMVGFTFFLSYYAVRSKMTKPMTGSEGLIGARGKVLKPVGPTGGQVFVEGEYWQAKSSEPIAVDEDVEVVKVEGLSLEVRRKD